MAEGGGGPGSSLWRTRIPRIISTMRASETWGCLSARINCKTAISKGQKGESRPKNEAQTSYLRGPLTCSVTLLTGLPPTSGGGGCQGRLQLRLCLPTGSGPGPHATKASAKTPRSLHQNRVGRSSSSQCVTIWRNQFRRSRVAATNKSFSQQNLLPGKIQMLID